MKPRKNTNWDWHWDIPRFNRRHWWDKANYKAKKTAQAAWYELLRRHPALELPMRERETAEIIPGFKARDSGQWSSERYMYLTGLVNRPPPELTLINLLPVIGRRSWVQLSEDDKKAFADALAKTSFQKARSRKSDIQVLVDPISLSDLRDLSRYARREAEDFADAMIPVDDGTAGIKHKRSFHPSSANHFSKLYDAICSRKAVIVFDFESDDPKKTAEQLAGEYLRLYRRAGRSGNEGKLRTDQWLGTIASYEASELERQSQPKLTNLKQENQKQRKAYQSLFSGIKFP